MRPTHSHIQNIFVYQHIRLPFVAYKFAAHASNVADAIKMTYVFVHHNLNMSCSVRIKGALRLSIFEMLFRIVTRLVNA